MGTKSKIEFLRTAERREEWRHMMPVTDLVHEEEEEDIGIIQDIFIVVIKASSSSSSPKCK